MNKYVAVFVLLIAAAFLRSQSGGREQPGPQPGGFTLLPNGWSIRPAGTQVPLDTLPMSTALSPDGKYLLVLNAGVRPPSISVLTTSPVKEIGRVPVADAWLGLTFAPGGKLVYASGGARGTVFEFSFSPAGELKPLREMPATAEHGDLDIIGDVALTPDGHLIYAAELLRDSIAVINPQSGRVIEHWKTGRRPYRILFAPDGKTFFVSSWADGSIYVHNSTTGEQIARLGLGPHTTDMILSARKADRDEDTDPGELPPPTWNYRLFVAAANTNNVYVVGVGDNNSLRLLETLNIALTPREPAGMTPSAVSVSTDQKRLFVVCSDANAVAVVDVSAAHSQVQGFVPTGWYPTSARALADGRLAILNGRGAGSQPNPAYNGSPVPRAPDDPRAGYVGNLQRGTMSVVEPFSDNTLDEYTATVRRGARYTDADLDTPNAPENSVIYSRPGRPSPLEHVVYIIKEGRTYDQVFGKLGKGNGDPALTLFDESAAPNHYKLAREFVLFDNFYVNADAGADGHNWSTAAIAPDFTQKLWPSHYAGRSKFYGFEGNEPANLPPAGYLWTNALAAGLTVRNYGEFVNGDKIDASVANITNKNYKGFDTAYLDVDRAKVYLDDLRQFEANNAMPRLTILHLANDGTSGKTPGRIAPRSAFADNDAALGMIVEAISHTKFWPTTTIFVLEADVLEDGRDHVDSHRSIAFAISPYARRAIVDSSLYNTASVLRTMELILGLRPMTHFDAGARPMSAAFAATADNSPYTAEKPRISLSERNPN